jgi:tetratricopeptide (TPR) repeat protein
VVFGLSRRKAWAWPGVAFLLALAPSSSVVPLAAVSEEYRMYLALAAVASAVVLGAHTLIRRWTPPGKVRTMTFRGAAGLTLAAVLGLVILTQERNRVYATPGGVWLDVIQKGRAGTRAYWNLAMACDEREDFDAAIRCADEVVARNPDMGVYEDLARSRLRKGDAASAERYLRHALAPRMDQSTGDRPVAVRHAAQLVMILKMQGRATEAQSLAAEHCERVRATLGDDHPWTRELMAIRDGGAADADTIGRER